VKDWFYLVTVYGSRLFLVTVYGSRLFGPAKSSPAVGRKPAANRRLVDLDSAFFTEKPRLFTPCDPARVLLKRWREGEAHRDRLQQLPKEVLTKGKLKS
jgi:hypothetical protein